MDRKVDAIFEECGHEKVCFKCAERLPREITCVRCNCGNPRCLNVNYSFLGPRCPYCRTVGQFIKLDWVKQRPTMDLCCMD